LLIGAIRIKFIVLCVLPPAVDWCFVFSRLLLVVFALVCCGLATDPFRSTDNFTMRGG